MNLSSVEYDEDSCVVLLTLSNATEDDALACDELVGCEVEVREGE